MAVGVATGLVSGITLGGDGGHIGLGDRGSPAAGKTNERGEKRSDTAVPDGVGGMYGKGTPSS